MSIKRKLALTAPVALNTFESLTSFEINYIYVNSDTLTVYLNPPGTQPVTINMDGSGAVVGKGSILLTPNQTTKVTSFIQAIEDACKINLELP